MSGIPASWGGRASVRPIQVSTSRPVAAAQANRKESDYLVPMLPFDTLERSIQEYKARNPHRKFINEKMLKIKADWVTSEINDLNLYSTNAIDITDEDVVEETEVKQPEGECINARVFLNSPLQPDASNEKHILQRIEILGCSVTTPTRQLRAYGGLVPASRDQSALINSLIAIVKSQSGLDLSPIKKWTRLGTIDYEAGTPPTVFFYPHISDVEGNLSIHTLVKTTEETYEEEVEEEDPETKEVVKKTETKTKSNATKVMIPVRMSLSTLRNYSLATTTHHETYELCAAVDLFDEWIRRDFISGIADVLNERLSATDFEVEAENQQRLRKKRRNEEEVECKRRKESKIALLKKQWELDDVGKTDEDKKDSESQRSMLLRDLDNEEKLQMEAFIKKQREEEAKEKEKTQTVDILNVKLFEKFQFIDRPRGVGTLTSTVINRDWVCV
eukprot:TRINITY_DN18631_c0_g1_i2.p1 TRINITY_DN18631_c0_g1~~TRINITY_DN18631_c0_g1_i2.p1  ORF type:complete len:446 (+),score=89.04 TRINITY_DN18631_c0_g1_i2:91-1428(+)